MQHTLILLAIELRVNILGGTNMPMMYGVKFPGLGGEADMVTTEGIDVLWVFVTYVH